MKPDQKSPILQPANDEIAKRRLADTIDEVSFDVGLGEEETGPLEVADPLETEPEPSKVQEALDPETNGSNSSKPLTEQLSDIVEDAKVLAATEIAYYQAKVEANIGATKRVFAYFGVGLALSTAGLTALILGLLMTLAPYVGPAAATVIVAGLSIGIGGLFMLNAVRRAKKLPIGRKEL